MFCSKCGKPLSDGSVFCNYCGSKQNLISESEASLPNPSSEREGSAHKCPYCGEFLPFDALSCPACGNEIRDKKAGDSINTLVEKIKAEPDEEKRIELIKLYPIPNSREAIFEFMMVAISQFDADFYASNSTANSIPSAWLTQIDLCYKKGMTLFTNPTDIERLNKLYNEVHGSEGSLTKANKTKMIGIIAGAALALIGTILFWVGGSSQNSGFEGVGVAMAAGGVVLVILAMKKKKTAKDLEYERQQRELREQRKREEIARRQQMQR